MCRQLTEINTKLEFESLQESEVILDENGQRSDGGEDCVLHPEEGLVPFLELHHYGKKVH